MLPISFVQIRQITITVVAANVKTYRSLKRKNDYNGILRTYCTQLLLNRIVSIGQEIDLSKSKLARAYGIHSMVIADLVTENSSTSSGECTVTTEISVKSFHSKDFFNLRSRLLKKDLKVGGLTVEVERLCKLLKLTAAKGSLCAPPTGVLLHGPPGCGKCLLAQHVAKTCGAVFLEVEASQLFQSEFGASAETLKAIFTKAVALTEEGQVVVFLDDIDSFCPNSVEASLGVKQITNALISELDKIHDASVSNILVIGATNSISSVARGLRRPGRFDQEMLVNVPNQEQRLSIVKLISESYSLSDSVCLETIVLRTAGFVGADLKALLEEAENRAFQHAQSDDQTTKVAINLADFEHALHIVKPSLRKGFDCTVDLPKVKWEDIGGLEDVKAEIQQSIEWPLLHSDALKGMDLTPTKGILLYGPPGCCKTTLVKAAASSCHVNFLSLTGAQVFSAYVGQSERIISEAFQKARALSPSILFFDEIETLVGKRSTKGSHSHVQERILATLLNEMDGIGIRLDSKMDAKLGKVKEREHSNSSDIFQDDALKSQDEISRKEVAVQSQVMVVGATNRPDMVDAALMRPGRLDKHIYVPPPDSQARSSILKVYTSKMPIADIDISFLAQDTEGYSGADLQNLCKEAGLCALREKLSQSDPSSTTPIVLYKHMRQALTAVRPSLTKDVISLYNK